MLCFFADVFVFVTKADVGDEGEKEDDEEDGRVSRRRLGACSAGLWTLAPVGGAYPHLTVRAARKDGHVFTRAACFDPEREKYIFARRPVLRETDHKT